MARRFLPFVFLAVVGIRAQAQTANFNALSAGTLYSAGTEFSNGGLDFDVLAADKPLAILAASSPINPSFSGSYLRFNYNGALNANLPAAASQTQFDFILDNPAVGFALNGAFVTYDQIPTTVNGVSLTYVLGSKTTPWGRISATGDIRSFIIVGNYFSIDNFSVTPLPGLAGDYNRNQIVDAADYVLWRKTLNTRVGLQFLAVEFRRGGNGRRKQHKR